MRRLVLVILGITLFVQAGAKADEACLDRLHKLDARFRMLAPIEEPGGCGAPAPFLLLSVGAVALSAPGTFTCPFAKRLAQWTTEVVAPAARRHLGTAPTTLRIGTSYQCRTQNRRPGAKLSEHSFANAVDLIGFAFSNGAALNIVGGRDADSPEARFQRAVRSGACRYFTTVIGPGTDEAHAMHLHLDLRGRENGYRICQ